MTPLNPQQKPVFPTAPAEGRGAGALEAPQRLEPAGEQRQQELTPEAELARMASDANLEMAVVKLPDSDVVVFRLVDPKTGEKVREIPSEDLVRQLAALRALSVDVRA